MKKNKMMRLASGLLVAVLITTSTISGTFAKYVTTADATDSARVAKWGVELQAVGNLFGDTYKDYIVAQDDATLTVQSVDKTADVVAPGTKNDDGFTFSLKGQPEVDGKVFVDIKTQNIYLEKGEWGVMLPVDEGVLTAVNFDEFSNLYYQDGTNFVAVVANEAFDSGKDYFTLEDYVKVDATYYPVIFKSTGGAGTSYDDVTTANNTMQALVYNTVGSSGAKLDLESGYPSKEESTGITTYKYSKEFNANDKLDDVINLDDMKITWEWAFDGQNDGADTILGMLKNTTEGTVVKLNGDKYTSTLTEYKDYSIDVMFDISITVEQVN